METPQKTEGKDYPKIGEEIAKAVDIPDFRKATDALFEFMDLDNQ